MAAIIPRTLVPLQPANRPEDWKTQLSQVIKTPEELLQAAGFDLSQLPTAFEESIDWQPEFALRVPHAYARRTKPGDASDPLLAQVLPLKAERVQAPGYVADPLNEAETNPHPGLIHKYNGRVLLILSPACAINCRYCFRREFPYAENTPGKQDWDQAINYIRQDESIDEVIYSGGDPLVNSNATLEAITQRILDIGHVKRLRIHTRLPVVLPDRIDEGLLDWLSRLSIPTSMVLHINHHQELDDHVVHKLQRLKDAGITLLNQTVLLKGVNDNLKSLKALSEAIFDAGVLPYYLHLLDKINGTAHFDIGEQEALQLVTELMENLPGYLVPKLVREIPGKGAKTPITPIL